MVDGISKEAQNETASVIATMEWWHAYHLSLLDYPVMPPLIPSLTFMKSILDEFEKQLEESRIISRLIRAEGILFEEHLDNDGKFATAPYFLGYLFIRKLLQGWEAKASHISRADLYRIANTCICVILPMTLLYPYLVEEELAAEMRVPCLSEETIVAAIESFSSLRPSELERIRNGGLLAIDLRTMRLIDISGGENPEDIVMKSILAAIFPGLDQAKLEETADLLWQCERAKFFHRTLTTKSMVIGVDPTRTRMLLADWATTKGRDGGIEASSRVWFEFKDDEEYERFIALYESNNAKIPQVEHRSRKEFRISSSEIVIASNLSAYVIFYPTGIGSAKEPNNFKRPLEILWRFGPDLGSAEDTFFTKSSSVHDNNVCIYWQSLNSRLLEGYNVASDPSFEKYLDTLGSRVDLYQMVFERLFPLSVEKAFILATQKDKSGKLTAESETQESEDEEGETAEERLGNYCLRILSASKSALNAIMRSNTKQWRPDAERST